MSGRPETSLPGRSRADAGPPDAVGRTPRPDATTGASTVPAGQGTPEARAAAVLADWLDRDDVSENRAADEVRVRAVEVGAALAAAGVLAGPASDRKAWEHAVLEQLLTRIPEKGAMFAPDYINVIATAMIETRTADSQDRSDFGLAVQGLLVSQHYRLAWLSARRRAARLRAAFEAILASPDDTQWWPVQPYMDPHDEDEVVEVQVVNADRLRVALGSAAADTGEPEIQEPPC